MARILYLLRKNNNQHSVGFGKYYAYAKSTEILDTRAMAEHIAEHGSIYTPDVVFGVLEKFRSCLIEQLLNSKKVKIDGLGIFYCTIEGKGEADPEKFNVAEHIKALHIRFLPEQEQEMNISSRQFLKKAKFISVDSLGGKPAPEQEEEGGEG